MSSTRRSWIPPTGFSFEVRKQILEEMAAEFPKYGKLEPTAIAIREENGVFGIDFQYRKRF